MKETYSEAFSCRGCKAEVRPYNLEIKKLDPKTISGFFFGYIIGSRGCRFYCPNHITRIIEFYCAIYLERNSGGDAIMQTHTVEFREEHVVIPFPIAPIARIIPFDLVHNDVVDPIIDNDVYYIVQGDVLNPVVIEPAARRSRRISTCNESTRFKEHEFNSVGDNDSTSFHEAISNSDHLQRMTAIEDELASIWKNGVWDLVELLVGCKSIGCKWVIKTNCDAHGEVERYKVRLVIKGYNQREDIEYTETFSHVFTKDSFCIVVTLVAHFDLELHQMDVKTAFLNGDLFEDVYMNQPDGFIKSSQKHVVCKLRKPIYGLKQASRQWYLKFDNVVTSLDFKENMVDQCIYLKLSGSKFIILVLCIDDILLASNDVDFLHDTKQMLITHFDMKDLENASFILGIEIHHGKFLVILGLSQKTYIKKILDRFNIKFCKSCTTPIQKDDKVSKSQCPQND